MWQAIRGVLARLIRAARGDVGPYRDGGDDPTPEVPELDPWKLNR